MSDVEILPDQPKRNEGEVMPDVPARVVSSILGLMGFCTALLVGLIAGNPGITILIRAMFAFVACAVIGRILGTIGEICVREFLIKYKHDRPTPELPSQLKKLYKARAADADIRRRMKKVA